MDYDGNYHLLQALAHLLLSFFVHPCPGAVCVCVCVVAWLHQTKVGKTRAPVDGCGWITSGDWWGGGPNPTLLTLHVVLHTLKSLRQDTEKERCLGLLCGSLGYTSTCSNTWTVRRTDMHVRAQHTHVHKHTHTHIHTHTHTQPQKKNRKNRTTAQEKQLERTPQVCAHVNLQTCVAYVCVHKTRPR